MGSISEILTLTRIRTWPFCGVGTGIVLILMTFGAPTISHTAAFIVRNAVDISVCGYRIRIEGKLGICYGLLRVKVQG